MKNKQTHKLTYMMVTYGHMMLYILLKHQYIQHVQKYHLAKKIKYIKNKYLHILKMKFTKWNEDTVKAANIRMFKWITVGEIRYRH